MKKENVNIKIISICWHRNGISGVGYWAIVFDWLRIANQNTPTTHKMIASLFETPGHCVIYELSDLAQGDVVNNRWSCDLFEKKLRKLAHEHFNGKQTKEVNESWETKLAYDNFNGKQTKEVNESWETKLAYDNRPDAFYP